MARRKNPVLYKLKRALALIVSKRTIAQKLLMFKKTRKYKLFKYYNYAYVGEYQFSPSESNTPLIFNHNCSSKKRRNRVLSLLCGGKTLDFSEFEALPLSTEVEEKDFVEFLPISNEEKKDVVEELEGNGEGNGEEKEDNGEENGEKNGEETGEKNGEKNGEEEDEESVDGRAERFIERFYQEMRLQRQDSFVQWKDMLQRSV
ncbi:hypothetical protein LUZ60_009910 [Juncus effusus]|nr:hypothetical protein LUZ60_009910 [Juncus effusus]